MRNEEFPVLGTTWSRAVLFSCPCVASLEWTIRRYNHTCFASSENSIRITGPVSEQLVCPSDVYGVLELLSPWVASPPFSFHAMVDLTRICSPLSEKAWCTGSTRTENIQSTPKPSPATLHISISHILSGEFFGDSPQKVHFVLSLTPIASLLRSLNLPVIWISPLFGHGRPKGMLALPTRNDLRIR